MKVSNERFPLLYMTMGSFYAMCGMGVGLYQHLSKNPRPVPLHSHLDSLGWLSMAVLGLIMQSLPWVRDHRLAAAQFWTTQAGTAALLGGLPLVFLHLTSVPITLGAILVPIGYFLFMVILLSGLFKPTISH